MATMKIDPTKSPREQFLDMVARTTRTRHPNDHITLGIPVRAASDDPKDTMISISVRAKHNQNDRIVKYQRIDLQTAFLFQRLFVNVPATATEQQIVDAINALGYTQIILSEVTLSDRVPGPNDRDVITITAKPESLLYVTSFEIQVPQAAAARAFYATRWSINGEHLMISPTGQRQLMVGDPSNFTTALPSDLTGWTILSSIGSFIQALVFLVDAQGNPLPEDQQPARFADMFYQHSISQNFDKAAFKAVIQQVIDAGQPVPAWYVPGASFMIGSVDESCPEFGQARIVAEGEQVATPVTFTWRLPRFKATWRFDAVNHFGILAPPASTVPSGTVSYSFPKFGKPKDNPTGGDNAVRLPGSGFSGGIWRGIDWCKNFNTTEGNSIWSWVMSGQIDESEDVPEWVGSPVSCNASMYYGLYTCGLDKVADPSTFALQELDPSFQSNLIVNDLKFPGGSAGIGQFTATLLPQEIAGLKLEFYPYETLPPAN